MIGGRRRGHELAEAGLQRAARVGFAPDMAAQVVLDALADAHTHGLPAMSSEDLVDRCKDKGLVPHDDRCFGGVFLGLARRGEIRRVGYGVRRKGHGTGGASLWALA